VTAVDAVEVRIEGVDKFYRTREGEAIHALDRLDAEIAPGEFVSVVGPSGCGKSTLLMLIAGLTPPTAGRIVVGGEEVARPHPAVGIVFQNDLLLYWRTVLDNVLLPIEIKKRPTGQYRPRAEQLLEGVGLAGFATRYPSELSGGMRQRVALCRALIQDPGLLLMDEPFGALDALTREQMILDLQDLWLRVRSTVVFITHSIEEAVFLSDRVLVMSPRPGRVDLELPVPLGRPRGWAAEDPDFLRYVRRVREVFQSSGVLRHQPASASRA
jgi:NitT/TauT family transport system ATP-binding protein